VAQIEPRAVALDLTIKRRLAVNEHDREAELGGEKIACSLDIGNEKLRLRAGENRTGRVEVLDGECVMPGTPVLSACQLSNPDCRATSS
jgi:hypothetical protein